MGHRDDRLNNLCDLDNLQVRESSDLLRPSASPREGPRKCLLLCISCPADEEEGNQLTH
jgi:hypothetical protein